MTALSTFLRKINPFDNPRTVYLNSDGSILNLTDKQAQKNKIKKEEAVGKNYGVLFDRHLQDKKLFDNLLEQAKKKGQVSHQITLQRHGQILRTTVDLESVKDERGGVIGFTVLHPKNTLK